MTEKQLQAAIVQMARLLGFSCWHQFDSRRSDPGWPDLTCARGRRLIFAELKTERGRVRPDQIACLEALERTGAEVYVWRPADWTSGWVERLLRDEQKKAA